MWLLGVFLVVPLIEIALFVQVGGLIGLWPTLGIVLLTAIAGTWLIRWQGASTLAEIRLSMRELRDPTAPLANGAMILMAGALLLAPGFFTDTLGLLLLLPAVRTYILRRIAAQVRVVSASGPIRKPAHDAHRPEVIDGDYEVIEPGKTGNSGWTRH